MSENAGNIPAQQDGKQDPANAPGRHRATQPKRTSTLYTWQPELDKQGHLILKRPIADTNGNVGNFGRALLRYTAVLEKEIKALREQTSQLPDDSHAERVADRITELDAELTSARTELETLHRKLHEQTSQSETHANEIKAVTEAHARDVKASLRELDDATDKIVARDSKISALHRILAVQDGFSQLLDAPLWVTRKETREETTIREFIVGNLKFYYTVKEAYETKDELIVIGANADVQLQPYYVTEFRPDGMPVSKELPHILFLAIAATTEGLEANRKRLDTETFNAIYRDMPQNPGSLLSPLPVRKPRGVHLGVPHYLARQLGDIALDSAGMYPDGRITPPQSEHFDLGTDYGLESMIANHTPECQTMSNSVDCPHPVHKIISNT